MNVVQLPQIEITIDDKAAALVHGIERETCPFCSQPDCDYDCDYSVAVFDEDDDQPASIKVQTESEVSARLKTNFGFDVLESFALAITSSLYSRNLLNDETKAALTESIQSTYDAIGNHCD